MTSDPLIGHQLANFVIERVLGRGGMAQVYFGRDVKLQRPVAIKVIDARYRDIPAYATRFVNEARVAASWRHENIVQVYYADEQSGLYYFAMEYIEGLDLASLLRQYTSEGELMPHADVLKIGKAVASALDYAHGKGVIHRDVKPSNVMISVDHRVILMDFGLALDVQQGSMGEVFGSPHYISPEQARRSADAVPASDLYSLGIMLYEMLTGSVPFDDPSPASLALQHLAMQPPPPRSINPMLNEATEQVILKALSKEPAERYPSGEVLIDALEKALSQPASVISTAELPPLPPGMKVPSRSMSGMTVSERVALHARMTHTEAMPSPPRIPPTKEAKRITPASAPYVTAPTVAVSQHESAPMPIAHRSRSLIPLALVAIVIVAVVVGLIVTANNGSGDNQTTAAELPPETPTTQTTQIEAPSAQAFTIATDAITPMATPETPTNTPELPTVTSAPVLPTISPSLPTALPIVPTSVPVIPTTLPVVPTDVPMPTETLMLAIEAAPTILYPTGRRVEFLWDENSFYWHNPQSESIPVSSIRFELIDAAGQPVGITFEGSRWAGVGFNRVESGKCAAIEISRSSSWMRPSICRNYNSIVNPVRDTELVFWTMREGFTQFRVLWSEQEIGRCEIAIAYCEVYLP